MSPWTLRACLILDTKTPRDTIEGLINPIGFWALLESN